MSVATAAPPGAKRGKAKKVALWALTGLLACLFAFAGSMKFVSPEAAKRFADFGYPDWFRVLIGVAEAGGALALLAPRTAFYAAGALAVVMAGAVFTHLRAGEVPQAAAPLVLLGLLALVGYARRPGAAR
jgi:putative oxidoreductase